MSEKITNALILPGVTAVSDGWSLLVGLVVDDERVAWGQCRFGSGSAVDYDTAVHLLQEKIIPSIIDQPLAWSATLMARLDEMVYEVEVVLPVTEESGPVKRSRRELFTGLVKPDHEIREMVERPLPAALRLGVSEAMLAAAAMVRGQTVFETAVALFGLAAEVVATPIHLRFDDLPNPTDPALSRIRAASYGLVVSDGEALQVLGNEGVRLQNRVRQLKNRVVGQQGSNGRPPEAGHFLFDVQGGFGRLYEGNNGRILGAIEGLERTAEDNGLAIVDPVIMEDWTLHLAKLKQLKNFMTIRQMKTKLLARRGVETVAAVEALAENDCCGGVVVDMAAVGSLARTAELVKAAKEQGLMVVLEGVRGETAVQIALALNPAYLIVGVGEIEEVGNEMNKAVAWARVKK